MCFLIFIWQYWMKTDVVRSVWEKKWTRGRKPPSGPKESVSKELIELVFASFAKPVSCFRFATYRRTWKVIPHKQLTPGCPLPPCYTPRSTKRFLLSSFFCIISRSWNHASSVKSFSTRKMSMFVLSRKVSGNKWMFVWISSLFKNLLPLSASATTPFLSDTFQRKQLAI